MDMYQHYHFMCNYFLFIFLCMVRFLLAAKCIQYKSFLMQLPKIVQRHLMIQNRDIWISGHVPQCFGHVHWKCVLSKGIEEACQTSKQRLDVDYMFFFFFFDVYIIWNINFPQLIINQNQANIIDYNMNGLTIQRLNA